MRMGISGGDVGCYYIEMFGGWRKKPTESILYKLLEIICHNKSIRQYYSRE